MNKNYIVSSKPLSTFHPVVNPLHQILWILRQFGIRYTDNYIDKKTYIHFQGSDFEISFDTDLPFNGFFISVDGPILPSTSYSRKGLVELIDFVLRSEFNLKKSETSILNSKEFDLLVKNYSLHIISKEVFFKQIYNGHINLELIEHTKLELSDFYVSFNKYSLDRSKVSSQLYALHCIVEKGEIEFHNAAFLHIGLSDYLFDLDILKEKMKNNDAEDFLTDEISEASKILRIRYDYDQFDALYFIINPDKFVLIEYFDGFG